MKKSWNGLVVAALIALVVIGACVVLHLGIEATLGPTVGVVLSGGLAAVGMVLTTPGGAALADAAGGRLKAVEERAHARGWHDISGMIDEARRAFLAAPGAETARAQAAALRRLGHANGYRGGRAELLYQAADVLAPHEPFCLRCGERPHEEGMAGLCGPCVANERGLAALHVPEAAEHPNMRGLAGGGVTTIGGRRAEWDNAAGCWLLDRPSASRESPATARGPKPENRPLRVYVASSWRNDRQPEVVRALRDAGAEVFDFRANPATTQAWGALGYDGTWTADQLMAAVTDTRVKACFDGDMAGLKPADVTVLVMPCGRSAHLELGWACGAGQRTAILLSEGCEPEVMQLMAELITPSLDDVVRYVMATPVPCSICEGGTNPTRLCGACQEALDDQGFQGLADRVPVNNRPPTGTIIRHTPLDGSAGGASQGGTLYNVLRGARRRVLGAVGAADFDEIPVEEREVYEIAARDHVRAAADETPGAAAARICRRLAEDTSGEDWTARAVVALTNAASVIDGLSAALDVEREGHGMTLHALEQAKDGLRERGLQLGDAQRREHDAQADLAATQKELRETAEENARLREEVEEARRREHEARADAELRRKMEIAEGQVSSTSSTHVRPYKPPPPPRPAPPPNEGHDLAGLAARESQPTQGSGLEIWPLVFALVEPSPNARGGDGGVDVFRLLAQDMRARHELGTRRYGVPLRAFNGRDALRDSYEEKLDSCAYDYQRVLEASQGSEEHARALSDFNSSISAAKAARGELLRRDGR